MKTIVLVLLASAALAAAPAKAAAPTTFHVAASAIVIPKGPSFAPSPLNFRQVYRVTVGVYCISTSPSFDWTRYTPLVSPLPAQSARRAGMLVASWEAGGQRCPAAAVQVQTWRLMRGHARSANDVAFQILIGGGD